MSREERSFIVPFLDPLLFTSDYDLSSSDKVRGVSFHLSCAILDV